MYDAPMCLGEKVISGIVMSLARTLPLFSGEEKFVSLCMFVKPSRVLLFSHKLPID